MPLPAIGAGAWGLAKALGTLATAGYTAYEGAKMIPYFTDQSQVLDDLTEKPEGKYSGKRTIGPLLDAIRIKTSGLDKVIEAGQQPEVEGDPYLSYGDSLEKILDKNASDAYERETKSQVRDAERGVQVRRAGMSPEEIALEGLQTRAAQAQINSAEAADEYNAEQLRLQGEANRQAAESKIAEIDALIAGNTGSQNVSLAEIALRQQQNEIARTERLQDKAAERRQAIFMALMALMN